MLSKAEVGPTSGPTRRLSHLIALRHFSELVGIPAAVQRVLHRQVAQRERDAVPRRRQPGRAAALGGASELQGVPSRGGERDHGNAGARGRWERRPLRLATGGEVSFIPPCLFCIAKAICRVV